MALIPAMTIARRALLANELMITVTANNISNIDTPGYARQRAIPTEAQADAGPFGSVGRGVIISTVQQTIDPFLEARLVVNGNQLGEAEVRSQLLSRLEGFFPDLNGRGLGKALEEFFSAANRLVTHPQEAGTRLALLAAADNAANGFTLRATDIQALQRETDQRISSSVTKINELTQQIATLNQEVSAEEIGGHPANALRDQRQLALRDLSKQINIDYFENKDGTINVQLGGAITLVSGTIPTRLGRAADLSNTGLDGIPLARVGMIDAGGGIIDVSSVIDGGELGALVEIRDGTLVDVSTDLDTLANSFRDAVNAIQTDAAGRDLDGNVGSELFDPSSTGAADIAVLISDPRKIAAARSSNPGDNSNALKLLGLQDTPQTVLNGETFSGYYSEIVTSLGILSSAAEDRHVLSSEIKAQLETRRESISGVSLQEEVTNLIKFQRSFQASASLISTADRMLEELIALVR